MRTWFDTTHCKSGAHCRRCRLRSAAAWRRSVAERFGLPEGATGPDFECPSNKPWRGDSQEPVYRHESVATAWQQMLDYLAAMPAQKSEEWMALEDTIRVHKDMISLHSGRLSTCWRNRQMTRCIHAWQTLMRKTGRSGKVVSSFVRFTAPAS